jgi:hypothetical protein
LRTFALLVAHGWQVVVPLLFGGLSYLAYRSSVMAAVGYGRAVEAAFDPYHLDLFSAYATHNVLGGTEVHGPKSSTKMLIGGRCPVVGENGDSVGTQIIEHATSFDDRGIDVGQRERREEAEPIRPPVYQPARVGADHAAWYGVLGSKTLLSAIGLDVFGALAKGHVTARLSRASLDSTIAAHAIFSTRL